MVLTKFVGINKIHMYLQSSLVSLSKILQNSLVLTKFIGIKKIYWCLQNSSVQIKFIGINKIHWY